MKNLLKMIVGAWTEYWSIEPYELLRGSRSAAIRRLLEKDAEQKAQARG